MKELLKFGITPLYIKGLIRMGSRWLEEEKAIEDFAKLKERYKKESHDQQ